MRLAGDWTLANYSALRAQLSDLSSALDDAADVDVSAITSMDTAGGQLLADLLGHSRLQQTGGTGPIAFQRAPCLAAAPGGHSARAGPRTQPELNPVLILLERIGAKMQVLAADLRELLGFIGLTLSGLLGNLLRPARWRLTAVAAQIEQTGIDAIPIVALLTFRPLALPFFTVDLVAFSFLREFGVLLTAILMAGRTASAFTAQIGSMKANEEIDAIRALGLNPLELLVLPRVIALLITLPALTFIAMLSGLLGGAMVCAFSLHISPTMFISMLQENVEVQHFLLGLAKAPVFAFLIAVIGCMEGFKVSGSAESVGEHTTSSVVQCIFVVILVDALAALFYMEMGW
ncbi:ABC transporter permease [Halopseudomonas pachastrellae]|nr:ABC transporter permease [Halopseudomonas pachastrellae]